MFDRTKQLAGKAYRYMDMKLDDMVLKATENYYDNFSKQSIDYKEDDYDNSEGWREKKGYLGFDFLKDIASQNSIFIAIMLRRINELAAFAHPQKNKYDVGYKVRMRDEDKEATKKEKSEIKEIEEFIFNTGLEKGRDKITKDPKNFEEFVRLFYRDRYRYNQVGIERVPLKVSENGDFKLHSFYHVPSNSLRYASNKKDSKKGLLDSIDESDTEEANKIKKEINDEDVYAVQLYHRRVISAFSKERLVLKQGNLDAELDNNGYSMGELELAVNLISSHIFAETHNRLYFKQGFSNKGILVLKKGMHRRDLERFRQHFRQQMQGTSNSFRVPIMSGQEVTWVPFQQNTKDMEWKEWVYYLIKLICAIFQISPEEINFDISKTGTGGLGTDSGGKHAEIRKMFKETGIRPMLRFLQGIINQQIIKYYNPDYYKKYVFEFVGLNIEQKNEEIERIVKEVQHYKTVNEIRAEQDLEELENGDIILNQVFLQNKQGSEMDFGSGEDFEEEEDESSENKIGEVINEKDKSKAEKSLNKSIKLHRVEYYGKD